MKKNKLGKKVVVSFILLAAALILCVSATVGICYCNGRLNEYSDLAFSYARTAVDYIDGDRVLSYVETGRKDAYYDQVMEFLNAAQKESDLQ